MMSGRLQGRFLSLLSNLVKAKTIVEIGTYTGYSTLCLAEGLTDNGKIHTIDRNEELVSIQELSLTHNSEPTRRNAIY